MAERSASGGRGQAEQVAALVAEVFAACGRDPLEIDAVAVTTGPGSFTGLRAALSLAHGIARAAEVPLLPVPVARALVADLPATLSAVPAWVVIDSRRGRVFLIRDGAPESWALNDLPEPDGLVVLVGTAAEPAASVLRARGTECVLSALRVPSAVAVGRVGLELLRAGALPSPALPIYVDAPEASLPQRDPRPPPRPLPVVATPAHAAAMAAIHEASFPSGERWTAEALATLVSQPGCFARLDPEGGFVLARVAADEAEILTLAVAPERRRRGIARALVGEARAVAAAMGAPHMLLEVAADNAAALALYGSLGFSPVGRRRGYYASGVDAVLMRA